jgi:hypothetical protein
MGEKMSTVWLPEGWRAWLDPWLGAVLAHPTHEPVHVRSGADFMARLEAAVQKLPPHG